MKKVAIIGAGISGLFIANLFKKKTDGAPDITPPPSSSNKKEGFLSKILKKRLGKSSVKGEEVIGVDFSSNEIRLAQINSDKSNQWILQKENFHSIFLAESI